jgi:hypothetical protein
MDETNRDSISNRLSRRMNFSPDLINNNNNSVNTIDTNRYSTVTSKRNNYYDNNKEIYLPNACSSAIPIIPSNKKKMPHLDNIDLRKPINYKKSNNFTNQVKDDFYTRTNGNSDIINQRIQDFSLLGTTQAYPMQNKSSILHLPNNKPINTRNETVSYGKY